MIKQFKIRVQPRVGGNFLPWRLGVDLTSLPLYICRASDAAGHAKSEGVTGTENIRNKQGASQNPSAVLYLGVVSEIMKLFYPFKNS